MMIEDEYPIGSPNKKWDVADKKQWLSKQQIKRSYEDEVLSKIESFKKEFDVTQYGALSFAPEKYPLYSIKTRHWDDKKPIALITGGVHGYETSGVQGALCFLETQALKYSEYFNLIVVPCVSPWGYETINRWNPYTIDPNRSFHKEGKSEEALLLMNSIKGISKKIIVHIDLHETTDTDNSEFRPALAAKDNIYQAHWDIPDGLYLVGDSQKPAHDFQKAIIKGVSEITHIAPPDQNGNILGEPCTQDGVINYEIKKLGLATGITDCIYGTTTEVYPDSPNINDEICILAQVKAIHCGLDYVLEDIRK